MLNSRSTKTSGYFFINDQISPLDELYAGSLDKDPRLTQHHSGVYFRCGAEMADYVELANPAPETILELPCGFGRVTRHLLARFPAANLTCVDVLPEAILFQRNTLKSNAVLIDPPSFDYSMLEDNSFDLVISGALLTHLNRKNTATLMEQMRNKTRIGGKIIATTRGEAAWLQFSDNPIYQVSDADRAQMLSDYRTEGFAFAPYAAGHTFEAETAEVAGDDYGIALTSPLFLAKLASSLGLRLLDYRMGGWDNHLDFFTFERFE